MSEIEVIGAVSGGAHYSPDRIRSALIALPTSLGHGETFTGRPGTQLRVVGTDVLKLRTEVPAAEAARWARATLQREQALGVHHASKTWFVVCGPATDNQWVAGNICSLLTQLHVSWRAPLPDSTARRARLDQMRELLRRHFEARRQSVDLDLGLSNFGLDRSNRLFYLDDDVYTAHPGHTALGSMLAVYLRSQDWIDSQVAAELGETVAELLASEADAGESIPILVDLLEQLYMPDGRARDCLSVLAATLSKQARAGSRSRRTTALAVHKPHQVAILSDIHANLPALDAALDFVRTLGLNEVVMLGDVVGYGPHPTQCIERLAETPIRCIKGNHDYACALERGEQPALPIAMSRDARWVADWTAARMSAKHRDWLRQQPTQLDGEGWLAVHGAPIDPNRFNGYVYEMTYERNLDELQRLGVRVCFHGHTHVRGVYGRVRGRVDAFYTADSQALDKYQHALVCPGSIGQPRNGMPGAQLAIYDSESHLVHFYSIAYDMDRTITDMQREGFPEALISRLRSAA
ncbi:MAG TPA: metallophosphoesterase family protein [Steroidobacteraceae bacterium]|nr:metallophosphoesterase family protein [Steroidobacteraceae bacterium]